MGIFDGFAEGFAQAIDDIRHEVEIAAYGRETTGNIELPEPAPVEAASSEKAAQTSEPSHNDLYFVQQPPPDMER